MLLATIAWGSSFVILKETIENVPGFFVIGIRFLASGIVVGLIFVKRLIKINKAALSQSVPWHSRCSGIPFANVGVKEHNSGKKRLFDLYLLRNVPFFCMGIF